MIPPDVVAAIFRKENKILLQFRINTPRSPLHWGLPAGRVEPGETGDVAIYREMMEELSISFVPTRRAEFSCTNAEGTRFDAYVVAKFEGEIKNNEPQHCGELGWFGLDELPSPLTHPTTELLRRYRTWYRVGGNVVEP